MVQKLTLSLLFFLLSADLISLGPKGSRFKIGYLLVFALWSNETKRMLQSAKETLSKVPRIIFLLIPPLFTSVANSNNLKQSLIWCTWLSFNLFVALSVYSFLRVQAFTFASIRKISTYALSLITLFAILQFVAIYIFNKPIFEPQLHGEFYRLNGVSGWPHFLNIFSFLLIPFVMLQDRLKIKNFVLIASLSFALVQSMAKTGWILFISFGLLLFIFQRKIFLKNYLRFWAPITILMFFIPTPSLVPSQDVRAVDKAELFASDLQLDRNTSGKDRMLINQMGLHVWQKNFLFGVGPRAYGDYIHNRFEQDLPGENKLDVLGQVNTRNENIWVELLAENGLIFTIGIFFLLGYLLWPNQALFNQPLYFASWASLVLYYGISGQFSQNILLTLVFAIWGVFFYSKEIQS